MVSFQLVDLPSEHQPTAYIDCMLNQQFSGVIFRINSMYIP